MYRINAYVNESGRVDVQGEIYNPRTDTVQLVKTSADSVGAFEAWAHNMRDQFDLEFSICIYRAHNESQR